MHLIVGLGNPGKEYALTRHNVGFLFLDYLVGKNESIKAPLSRGVSAVADGGFSEWKKGYQGLYTSCILEGTKCILLKPETYMNLSGKSVQACATFFKIHPRDIIIISDDIDMEFGKIRFRETGSGGGHNGLISIIETLGTSEIKRIKIGIGRNSNMNPSDWVLSKFTKEEKEKLEDIFIEVEKKLLALI